MFTEMTNETFERLVFLHENLKLLGYKEYAVDRRKRIKKKEEDEEC